jgi:hypothetical protein
MTLDGGVPATIPGYVLDDRVYDGPLGEIWLGQASTGMAVAVLILTDAGAADPEVRRRFAAAGRSVPLWAASFSADRPYQIVRLVPGQTGAIALLDPLLAVIGHTDELTTADLRRRLLVSSAPRQPLAPDPRTLDSAEAAAGPKRPDAGRSAAGSQPPDRAGTRGRDRLGELVGRLGRQAWVLVAVATVCLGGIAYAAGAVTRTAVDGAGRPAQPGGRPPAVSPSALPPEVILPGISKVPDAQVRTDIRPVSVVGPTYGPDEPAEPVVDLGVPFAFRWPAGSAGTISLGESSYAIYRRVIAGQDPTGPPLDLRIAAHPCAGRAACLAERARFDARWTAKFAARAPATSSDARTWFTQTTTTARGSYELSMTRVFTSRGRWWLVGAVITAETAQRTSAQKVINDIRTQTP